MKRKTLVVFFNASVILAGLASPSGGSAKLLKLVKNRRITGVISEIILDETIYHAEKIGWTKEDVEKQILAIFSKIVVAPPPSSVDSFKKIIIDYGDAHILASCKTIRADFLVTLDKKHLLILKGKIKGLKIVSPAEFLLMYTSEVS